MPVHRRMRRGSRLYELDLLRLAAAVSVMIYHFTTADQQLPEQRAAHQFYPELRSFSNYGYMGVDLFFVISGFVILMSGWGRRPGDFAVSRFVRLFPAYWFSALVVLAVFCTTGAFWSIPGETIEPLRHFIPNLTMLQKGLGVPSMDGVYWTLWVELHFYVLIVPLLWRGVTYRRCLAFMAVWLILSVYAQEGKSPLLTSLLVPKYAPYFIAGMAFFLIYKYGSNPVAWAYIAACWALRCHYGFEVIGSPRAIDGYALVIPLLTTAIFVVMGLVATHRLSRLRWSGLAVLGALTYPLYLLHKVVAIALFHWFGTALGRWQFLALAMGAALTVSYVVYRLVEAPAQRWLRPRLHAAVAQIRSASDDREPAFPGLSPETAPSAPSAAPAAAEPATSAEPAPSAEPVPAAPMDRAAPAPSGGRLLHRPGSGPHEIRATR